MEDNYKIQCDVHRIKGEKDGKSYDFLTYTAYDKQGKKCKLKLTKDCANYPKKEGCYYLNIAKADIRRDKQVKYREYWVRNIVSYDEFDGFDDSNEEDLPF